MKPDSTVIIHDVRSPYLKCIPANSPGAEITRARGTKILFHEDTFRSRRLRNTKGLRVRPCVCLCRSVPDWRIGNPVETNSGKSSLGTGRRLVLLLPRIPLSFSPTPSLSLSFCSSANSLTRDTLKTCEEYLKYATLAITTCPRRKGVFSWFRRREITSRQRVRSLFGS